MGCVDFIQTLKNIFSKTVHGRDYSFETSLLLSLGCPATDTRLMQYLLKQQNAIITPYFQQLNCHIDSPVSILVRQIVTEVSPIMANSFSVRQTAYIFPYYLLKNFQYYLLGLKYINEDGELFLHQTATE